MSRELTLTIDFGNDAFVGPNGSQEAARIVENFANEVRKGLLEGDVESGVLRDLNGNSVGQWLIEGELECEIVGYVIVDREGERIDDEVFYEQIDAQRTCDEMVEEDLNTFAEAEDDPETFKALQKHNDAPYSVMGIDNEDDLVKVARLEEPAGGMVPGR